MDHISSLEPRRLLSAIDLRVDSFNTDGLAVQTELNYARDEWRAEVGPGTPGKVAVVGSGAVPVTVRGADGDAVRFNFDPARLRLLDADPADGPARELLPGKAYEPSTFARAGAVGRVLFVEPRAAGVTRLTGVRVGDDRNGSRDAVKFTLIDADLDADASRDGVVTNAPADESAEDVQTPSTGALVLPNFDRDGSAASGGTGVGPDNWPGGDWDGDFVDDPANAAVDGNGDADDLGEVVLRRLGTDFVPANLRVTLALRAPATEHAFFATVPAERRVRVFLPTGTNGADAVAQAGDRSVLGPEAGALAEFAGSPTTGQLSTALLAGHGAVRLGVEGIEQGAAVEIVMTVFVGDAPLSTDVVNVRVAPFVLNGHDQPVNVAGNAPTVAVARFQSWDGRDLNADLRGALSEQFGDNVIAADIADAWIQDGYEIGYAQVPGKAMPVAVELVRARDRDAEIMRFLRNDLLRPGFGVNVRILQNDGSLDFGSQDLGGNIESVPNAAGGLPFFFHGDGMFDAHRDFFIAQGANPELAVDVSWLLVGHVDEVVSTVPGGEQFAVADPELAWALLMLAKRLDPAAAMLQNMNEGVGDDGLTVDAATDEQDGVDATFFPGAIARDAQVDPTHPIARGVAGIRAAVANAMNLPAGGPESTPVASPRNAGPATLDRGGSFSAWLAETRHFRIDFDTPTTYRLSYRDAGSDAWRTDPTPGSTAADCVFPEANAYLLRHWWNESAGDLAAGDRFTFAADPAAGVIEIPIAFGSYDFGDGTPNAYAYTTDHVNALVDGDAILTGRAHGPRVDRLGTGSRSDLLEDYVAAAFGKAYRQVTFADARAYHNGVGSIHCATNPERTIPKRTWWTATRPADDLFAAPVA